MKSFMFAILMALSFALTTAHAETEPPSGLPLPWPFPWAKECPVDWQKMAGRYVLSEHDNKEQIDLKITVITSNGFRLVRLSRYDRNDKMIADGFSFVTLNQRMLRMKLVPHNFRDEPSWALIKLHYADGEFGCGEDHLVPILTFEKENSFSHVSSQYRMVRL